MPLSGTMQWFALDCLYLEIDRQSRHNVQRRGNDFKTFFQQKRLLSAGVCLYLSYVWALSSRCVRSSHYTGISTHPHPALNQWSSDHLRTVSDDGSGAHTLMIPPLSNTKTNLHTALIVSCVQCLPARDYVALWVVLYNQQKICLGVGQLTLTDFVTWISVALSPRHALP